MHQLPTISKQLENISRLSKRERKITRQNNHGNNENKYVLMEIETKIQCVVNIDINNILTLVTNTLFVCCN